MYPRIRAILFLLDNKCTFVYIRSVARRKTISDEALLDGLMSAITEHGPAGLTFAGAAAAVTLSPATLVQRFGSREAMVEAILLRAWDRLPAPPPPPGAPPAARARGGPPGAPPRRGGPPGGAGGGGSRRPSDAPDARRDGRACDARGPALAARGLPQSPAARAGQGLGRLPGGGTRPAPEWRCARGPAARLADGARLARGALVVGLYPLPPPPRAPLLRTRGAAGRR